MHGVPSFVQVLEDKLRLKSPNVLYPPNLYKGTVWLNGGNNKMLYVGAQDQYYTYTMFDVQAMWAVKYVLGQITLPDKYEMDKDWKMWSQRYNNYLIYILHQQQCPSCSDRLY